MTLYEQMLEALKMSREFQRLLGADADTELIKILDKAIARAERIAKMEEK